MKKYFWIFTVIIILLCISVGCGDLDYDNENIQKIIALENIDNNTGLLSITTPCKNINGAPIMHTENTNPPSEEAEVGYTASFITPLFKSTSLYRDYCTTLQPA